MDTHTSTAVSRHATSEGVVVWNRCACGRLQMSLVPYGVERGGLVAGGHRSVPRPRPLNDASGAGRAASERRTGAAET
ncbi:MAG TPA: hypothetical protein VN520_11110 [Streptomyces sp.]|uniref:hypothetical protein n=1 Tax=Streptomyces sp. TaxID=1931 RepID=UPI002C51E80D|nr:hypothetical protein [Streptomyces sp.]HWU06914.1 hypothetical protein [Streptomyces sp.]